MIICFQLFFPVIISYVDIFFLLNFLRFDFSFSINISAFYTLFLLFVEVLKKLFNNKRVCYLTEKLITKLCTSKSS